MSTNIELVNKALTLLNDVPHAAEANEVVLVIRELKSNLLDNGAGALAVTPAIIKLDDVSIIKVKGKRGPKLGSKFGKKAKNGEQKVGLPNKEVAALADALNDLESVGAIEAPKAKGKPGRPPGYKAAKKADAVVVPTAVVAGEAKETHAQRAKKIKG